MFQRKKRVEKSKAANGMVACCLVLAALGVMALAQVEPFAEAPVALQPAPEVAESTLPEAPAVAEDELGVQSIQTLSFKEGMTISAALRFLQLKYEKNIIPISRMDDQITVLELFNVTFDEALQAIIGINKFEVQENGSITVYTPEEYEQMMDDMRRMEIRIFTLNYISAEDAKDLLLPVLSDDGKMEATKAPETSISSGSSGGGGGGGGGGEGGEGGGLEVIEGGTSISIQDAIVMKDYPENIAEAESLLKQLDVRPLQVLVEATILAATLIEGLELGVDLSLMAGASLSGSASTETIVAQNNIQRGEAGSSPILQIDGFSGTPIETFGFAKAGGNGLRLGISTGDVRVFITALETVTDVTVLANPKILALNKQLGTVFIGQRVGYRSSTTVSGSGNASSGEVKWLNTGTSLTFRPYIAEDGYIRMDIYPKDSSLTGEQIEGIPSEVTAELSTNIMVKDGQTIVIGGLFRDQIVSSKSQVPLLGELPVLGELFKGTADRSIRQEVIILLTTHIIESPSELEGDERAADVERKRLGARNGLHWLGVARLSEDSYAKAAILYSDGDPRAALRELNWTLNLRPTYMEALRLRERIVQGGFDPKDALMERIIINVIEREESQMWIRR